MDNSQIYRYHLYLKKKISANYLMNEANLLSNPHDNNLYLQVLLKNKTCKSKQRNRRSYRLLNSTTALYIFRNWTWTYQRKQPISHRVENLLHMTLWTFLCELKKVNYTWIFKQLETNQLEEEQDRTRERIQNIPNSYEDN